MDNAEHILDPGWRLRFLERVTFPRMGKVHGPGGMAPIRLRSKPPNTKPKRGRTFHIILVLRASPSDVHVGQVPHIVFHQNRANFAIHSRKGCQSPTGFRFLKNLDKTSLASRATALGPLASWKIYGKSVESIAVL